MRGPAHALEPRQLLDLHVRALFRCDDEGRLVAVNEADGGPAPRFFLGRTADGPRCWFRDDLEASLAHELEALAGSLPPDLPLEEVPALAAPFVKVLEKSEPVTRVWTGPAFLVPEGIRDETGAVAVTPSNAGLLRRHFDEWLGDVEDGLPFAAVLERDHAVSICYSPRITAEAHEAGLKTAPGYRGRGYAGAAVAAWAGLARDRGCIPLYSTSWENRASRAVARKLGLSQYGADLHVR